VKKVHFFGSVEKAYCGMPNVKKSTTDEKEVTCNVCLYHMPKKQSNWITRSDEPGTYQIGLTTGQFIEFSRSKEMADGWIELTRTQEPMMVRRDCVILFRKFRN